MADVLLFPVVAIFFDGFVALVVSVSVLASVLLIALAATPIRQRNEARRRLAGIESARAAPSNVSATIGLSPDGMRVVVTLANNPTELQPENQATIEACRLNVESLDGTVLLHRTEVLDPQLTLDVYGSLVGYTIFTKQIRANGSEAMTNDIMKPGGSKDSDYWRQPCKVSVQFLGKNLDKIITFHLRNTERGPFELREVLP